MIVHVSRDGSLMSIWFHSLRPILTVWCMVNLVVLPCCSWSNTQSSGLRNSNQAILLIAQSYWKKQQHQFRNQLQPSLHRSVIQNRQLMTRHIFNRLACCTTARRRPSHRANPAVSRTAFGAPLHPLHQSILHWLMKPSEGSHITTPTAHFHPVIEDNMWVWKTLTPFCSHPRYQRLRQCLKFNDALKVQNAQCMQPMCKSYWSGERFEVVQTTQWKSSNLGWDFPSWYFLVLPGRPREVFSQRGWLVRSEVASCRRKWPSQHWNLSVWLCFSHEEYAWNSWNTHCFSYTSYMMQGTNEPMQVVCKYMQILSKLQDFPDCQTCQGRSKWNCASIRCIGPWPLCPFGKGVLHAKFKSAPLRQSIAYSHRPGNAMPVTKQ